MTSFWQTSPFIIGRFGVLATCPTRPHSATQATLVVGAAQALCPAGGSIYKARSAGLSTDLACWIIFIEYYWILFNWPSQEVNRSVGLVVSWHSLVHLQRTADSTWCTDAVTGNWRCDTTWERSKKLTAFAMEQLWILKLLRWSGCFQFWFSSLLLPPVRSKPEGWVLFQCSSPIRHQCIAMPDHN